MKVSFVGGGSRLAACYKIFEGRSGFEISGVYSNSVESCAEIAIAANAKIYQSLNSLYMDSDVIVLAVKDEAVPGIIDSLSRLHAHGKVFVTISNTLTSSELSTAYPNACAIINSTLPFTEMSDGEIHSASLVCEVFGKNYNRFCDAVKQSHLNCTFVTAKQLQLFRTSLHMAKYGIMSAICSARQLIKISTVSDDAKFLIPIIKKALGSALGDVESGLDSPYKNARLDEIRKHRDILAENGIDSTSRLYNATALFMTERSCSDREASDEVARLINNG